MAMTQRERAQSLINDLFDLLEGHSSSTSLHVQDLANDIENVLHQSQNDPPLGESDGSINARRFDLLRRLHDSCKSIIKAAKAAKEDF